MSESREQLIARITQVAGVCGGRPCVRDTRIRVSDVLETLADGVETEELLADFPLLEREDVHACLLFAALRTSNPGLAA